MAPTGGTNESQSEPSHTYTGAVTPGGPPDTRELPGLHLTKVSVGDFDNNCYLLRCTETGEQLLIDAANESDRLLALAGERGLDTVVTTHRHWDHVQALSAVTRATGARSIAHPDDASELPVPPTQLVNDGDEVTVGRARLQVIHLVGHTPGSIALLYEPDPRTERSMPHLFTGDCLFPGGPGNTEKDPDRFTSLMDDLERKVFGPLPDGTWIYPGHGNDTTLGAERPHLYEWRQRGW
jgi:glyoxylase-like metal-dependent hydrolase (beta-lactamase superfamily II)